MEDTLSLVIDNRLFQNGTDVDAESGIGSLPSDEDLRYSISSCSITDTKTVKPKRHVQFQSAENLVVIKEIPPRGFYGSDVSDSDSGTEDDSGDIDDVKEDSDQEEEEEEESDSSASSDEVLEVKRSQKIRLARNQLVKRSYSVRKPPGNIDQNVAKLTAMLSTSDNNKQPMRRIKSATIPRRTKIAIRNQNAYRSAHMTKASSNRVSDTKKRKGAPKLSYLLKSTSSSRSKEIKARPRSANFIRTSTKLPKYEIIKPATPQNRIIINSPTPNITEFVSDTDSVGSYNLYNHTFKNSSNSGHVYKMNGFIFPADQTSYLPDIGHGISRSVDYKPITRHKQYNAWQIANGNLDSKLFHTPSISPLWENVHQISISKLKPKS